MPAPLVEHPSGFNLALWRRFVQMASPYWHSEERWRARGQLLLLIALLLGQTAFNVVFNNESGEFTSALAARDAPRFWSSIERFVWVLLAAVPIYALYYFVRDTLGLRWRRWLTNALLDRYFQDHAFYRFNALAGMDNPDQRISEDVNSFTQQSLYFLMIGLGALIQLVAFAGVLWSISQMLVGFLVAYAVVGTFFTATVFGRHLVSLNFRQLRREADFRFGLVRVRENAEPIALHDGEPHEKSGLQRLFGSLYDNYRQVLKWQLRLNLFQYAHSFLTLVLPSIIIADDVLSGRLEVGRAVQAAGAFAAMLSALTVIVERFESLSRFAAGVDRLHAFSGLLDEQASARAAPDRGDRIRTVSAPMLALHDLTVHTPLHEHTIVRNLNLQVAPGDGLVIVGPSGSGKSSLLRAIAGLWSTGSGVVERPAAPDMLFLPQQPYLPLGNLRGQVLYPHADRVISDAEVQALLAQVNLGDLASRVGGLDAEHDWSKLLSVGEQQRLAFARALLTRPRYVMLDEATSALDAANEDRLYRQLATLSITPVSVSHRPALLHYHSQVLSLDGQGTWSVRPATDSHFVRDEA